MTISLIMFRFLLMAYLLFQSSIWNIHTQDPVYRDYQLLFDLPTNNFYCGLKSSSGQYYFGSDVGGFSFDGYQFTQLKTRTKKITGEVFNLFEDFKQGIWMTLYDGRVFRKKAEDLYFESVKIPEQKGYISSYLIDSNTVYLGSSNGYLYKFNDEQLNKVWQLKGHLLFLDKTTSEELSIYTRSSKLLLKNSKLFVTNTYSHTEKFLRLTKIDDMIYAARNDSILILKDNSLIKALKLPDKYLIQSIKKVNNNIFVLTNKGVFELNTKTFEFENHLFKDLNTTNVLPDLNSGYILTTIGKSIKYVNLPSLKSNFNRTIKCLFSDGDSVILGTDNNTFYLFLGKDTIKKSFNSNTLNNITSIKKINKDLFIIGKSVIGILRNRQWYTLPFGCNDIELTNNGDYLVGTNKSYVLSTDDLNNLIHQNSNYDRDSLNYIDSHPITKMIKWKNKVIVGTNQGLFIYENKTLKKVKYAELNQAFINKLSIEHSNLYIASSNGIYMMSLNNNTYNILPLKKNLPVVSITNDYPQKVYFSSSNKIYEFSLNDSSITCLISLPKQLGSINDLLMQKDHLTIGTNSGLYKYQIITDKPSKVIPLFYLDSILINGKKISNTKELAYFENNIHLYFKSITPYSKDVSYYYRFKNKDGKWKKTNDTDLEFSSLNYEKYELQIYAETEDELKSNIYMLFIHIKPPFWEKWWFFSAVLIILVAILLFVMKKRLKNRDIKYQLQKNILLKERKAIELEYALLESENKALRMQMNPHFIFNALNNIKGLYALDNKVKANQYLVTFSKMIRGILENEEEKISIKNEIELITAYLDLAKFKTKHPFTYQINVNENIDINNSFIPSMMIQPFIENAILHGIKHIEDGKIEIIFNLKDNGIEIVIRDNGVGFINKKLTAHKSISTELTKKRLLLLEKKHYQKTELLIKERSNNKGIEVTLLIPNLSYD